MPVRRGRPAAFCWPCHRWRARGCWRLGADYSGAFKNTNLNNYTNITKRETSICSRKSAFKQCYSCSLRSSLAACRQDVASFSLPALGKRKLNIPHSQLPKVQSGKIRPAPGKSELLKGILTSSSSWSQAHCCRGSA